MSDSRPSLTLQDVRRVAKLARLSLPETELEVCRQDLAAILDYVAALGDLDLEDVEPMAHPGDQKNRIDGDEPVPGFPVQEVLDLAPDTEGDFIAVPKVLGDEGGSA